MKALSFLIVPLVLSSINCFASEANPITQIDKLLKRHVDEKRKSANLAGLGAIVIQDSKIIGLSVSGERKKGDGVLVSQKDLWHIGSITKSFTATMIARLIEKGDLKWDTSIKDVFPDEKNIHSEWNDVTLGNLLAHTSGATRNFSLLVSLKNPNAGSERMAARESAVRNILSQRPEATPGGTFVYSNVGYTIAGVIAENKAGASWENLIRKEVFSPLGIKSGGFGAPKDIEGKLSQPWGHKKLFGFTKSGKDDNTPIIGPAGTIHLSLNDLALYADEHLQGIQGRSSFLKRESFQRLHHPNLNSYAYGWVIGPPEELGVGTAHWHNGSNTMWYALLVILPDINAAIAITSNDGNFKVAEYSAWEIVKRLAKPLEIAHKKSMSSGAVKSAGY
ncbi:serine hydrolase domain-containing protein [Microbulbifer aggregans]|uniref:serine hydrolase domain-containing protein n=1 Tax=Microbulbifer aggregans TaxID=1769779 RepID=UPI001CFE964B|nr:serine hydrolase domain-containing protein [Microbulbifer aggregans]